MKRYWRWFVAFRERHPYWMLYEIGLIVFTLLGIGMGPAFVIMQSIRSGFSISWAMTEMVKVSGGIILAYGFYILAGILASVYYYYFEKQPEALSVR